MDLMASDLLSKTDLQIILLPLFSYLPHGLGSWDKFSPLTVIFRNFAHSLPNSFLSSSRPCYTVICTHHITPWPDSIANVLVYIILDDYIMSNYFLTNGVYKR